MDKQQRCCQKHEGILLHDMHEIKMASEISRRETMRGGIKAHRKRLSPGVIRHDCPQEIEAGARSEQGKLCQVKGFLWIFPCQETQQKERQQVDKIPVAELKSSERAVHADQECVKEQEEWEPDQQRQVGFLPVSKSVDPAEDKRDAQRTDQDKEIGLQMSKHKRPGLRVDFRKPEQQQEMLGHIAQGKLPLRRTDEFRKIVMPKFKGTAKAKEVEQHI